MNERSKAFVQARDFLLAHRTDYESAYAGFRWPRLEEFNWALDYFDRLEFAALPKTISGKIRRNELRRLEAEPHHNGVPRFLATSSPETAGASLPQDTRT